MKTLTTIKFILATILCLSISLQTSFAQVTYQSNATASNQPASSGTTMTIPNFMVPAGNNVLLVIGTRIASNVGTTINNINYNGINYTSEQVYQANNDAGIHTIWAITLGNVGSAITGDITITIGDGLSGRGAIAASFSNVNQTTPTSNGANNLPSNGSTSSSVSVNGLASDMVIDFIGASAAPTFVVGSGQTGTVLNTPINSNGKNRLCMSYELATSTSTAMDWTSNLGNAMTHVGINIIANSYPALPVELTQFEARPKNKAIELMWQTASEENNEGFEVQKSTNGETWKTLDFAQGNGTTLETQEYTYTDENPIQGINYYRLKQIDFDGQFEYSNIVNITMKQYGNNTMNIFPNPVQDELNIVNGEGQATIYNVLGQALKQFKINNSTLTINTSDLPEGQYILHILQQNGNVVTKQFVK